MHMTFARRRIVYQNAHVFRRQAVHPRLPEDQFGQLFARFDTDGSELITLDEFGKMYESLRAGASEGG